MPDKFYYKTVIAGDGGVGKTTLLHRYVKGIFLDDTRMTIGVEFFQEDVEVGREKMCALLIWDLGGQEQFRRLIDRYIIGTKGAMVMFDLTRQTTFHSIPKWVKILRQEDSELPLILVAAKADHEIKSSIKQEDIMRMKEKFNFFDYVKTSAKTGLNVQESFQALAKSILDHQNQYMAP